LFANGRSFTALFRLQVGKVLKFLPVHSLGGRDASAGIKLMYGSLKV